MAMVLFVNACLHGSQSRTLRLANAFLTAYAPDELEEVTLDRLKLEPLDSNALKARDTLIEEQDFKAPAFDCARQFQRADLIVIAAPFWEGTFPAMLHSYLEHICVSGLTFTLNETGYQGLCRAKEAVYFTTRGGIYESGPALHDEHAKGVLQTILRMLGVEKLSVIAAEGLDIHGFDVEKALSEAEDAARELALNIAGREE